MPYQVLSDFQRRLRSLEATRQRMEDLLNNKAVRLMDVHSVYEAIFIRAVAGFETFLEELFLEIMRENVSYPTNRRVAKRVKFSSRTAMMDVLFEGRDYLEWLPFPHTKKRVGRYLLGGRPFSDLDDGDISKIQTIVTIRHAIAHESKHSADKFVRIVTSSLTLLRGEKRPAGFLRSELSPNRKRIQVYFADMLRMAQKVC